MKITENQVFNLSLIMVLLGYLSIFFGGWGFAIATNGTLNFAYYGMAAWNMQTILAIVFVVLGFVSMFVGLVVVPSLPSQK